MKLSAILLAAGAARRFGSAKQLAYINDQRQTLLNHVVSRYLELPIDDLTLVLGANSREIEESLIFNDPKLRTITCPNWTQGMGTSLAYAATHVLKQNLEITHLLVGLGDQIAVSSSSLRALCDLACQFPENAVASRFDARIGPPAVFPLSKATVLTELSGDTGAKRYLQQLRSTGELTLFDCPDAGWDIDTPDDLRRWQLT